MKLILLIVGCLLLLGFASVTTQENLTITSSFEKAIPLVLKHEGHLVDDKADKGGLTNYGISFRFLQSAVKDDPKILDLIDADHKKMVDAFNMKHMTMEEAELIYKEEFWDKFKIGAFAHQELANKFLDLSVNMGHEECSKIFMRAFGKVNPKFGASTLLSTIVNGVNKMPDVEQAKLLVAFCQEAEDFYQKLEQVHPVYKKFLKGWVARVWDGVKR